MIFLTQSSRDKAHSHVHPGFLFCNLLFQCFLVFSCPGPAKRTRLKMPLLSFLSVQTVDGMVFVGMTQVCGRLAATDELHSDNEGSGRLQRNGLWCRCSASQSERVALLLLTDFSCVICDHALQAFMHACILQTLHFLCKGAKSNVLVGIEIVACVHMHAPKRVSVKKHFALIQCCPAFVAALHELPLARFNSSSSRIGCFRVPKTIVRSKEITRFVKSEILLKTTNGVKMSVM